jgi:lysophospholipase L1-like esterase
MSTNHAAPSLTVKLVGAVISIVIFLALVELLLAIIQPNLYHRNQFFPRNRDIDFPEVYKRDARLLWRFRPGITTTSSLFSELDYTINSCGMRGPEIAEPKSGYRIIAVGNSCTFGWGVAYRDTWVHQLQIILNEQLPGRSIELINAGVPGYSSHQGKRYLADELLSLQPDIVLIMFGFNDHYPTGRGVADSAQQLSNVVLVEAQNLLARLRLYRLVRKLFLSFSQSESAPRLDDMQGVKRVSRSAYFENLREIVRTARDHDVQPVLLVPPVASLENYFDGAVSTFHRLHELYQMEMIKASQYEEAVLVDLQEAFNGFGDLFDDAVADPIHFNREGHRVTAQTVADAVAPLIDKQ